MLYCSKLLREQKAKNDKENGLSKIQFQNLLNSQQQINGNLRMKFEKNLEEIQAYL